jgi:hypothetical protein
MKLSSPTRVTFWVALIIAIVGVVLYILGATVLPVLAIVGFVVLAAAFVLLFLSVCIKGL